MKKKKGKKSTNLSKRRLWFEKRCVFATKGRVKLQFHKWCRYINESNLCYLVFQRNESWKSHKIQRFGQSIILSKLFPAVCDTGIFTSQLSVGFRSKEIIFDEQKDDCEILLVEAIEESINKHHVDQETRHLHLLNYVNLCVESKCKRGVLIKKK